MRLGFSLLELMIVLGIMALATAVAWPNLQRNLRRADLSQSAVTLRELLDEARQLAMREGHIYLVKVSIGGSQIELVSLDRHLSEETQMPNSNNQIGSNVYSTDTASSVHQSMSPLDSDRVSNNQRLLVDSVVVADVQWRLPSDAIELSELNTDLDPLNSPSADNFSAVAQVNDTASPVSQIASELTPAERLKMLLQTGAMSGELRSVCLPFLPSGQGRDAKISLVDTKSGLSIELIYRSTTGVVEILP